MCSVSNWPREVRPAPVGCTGADATQRTEPSYPTLQTLTLALLPLNVWTFAQSSAKSLKGPTKLSPKTYRLGDPRRWPLPPPPPPCPLRP